MLNLTLVPASPEMTVWIEAKLRKLFFIRYP
jgi:hypothetical protein